MFKNKLILIAVTLITLFSSPKVFAKESNSDFVMNFESFTEVDSSKHVIILNDGSQWVVEDNNIGDSNQILCDWEKGDEIRIEYKKLQDESKYKYFLKNVRNRDGLFVDLDFNCVDQLKTHYIEKIDKNGYSILTQNGLEFILGWVGALSARNWRKGDRIIINKSDYVSKYDYLLINVDHQGKNAWVSLVEWR